MSLTPSSTYKLLHSGLHMPCIALGVYQSTAAFQSVTMALKHGYRHVDSARVYRNEEQVGDAVREALAASTSAENQDIQPKPKRSDLWLTTKIPGREQDTKTCTKVLRQSTRRLGDMGPWDLVLLHDPTGGRERRLQGFQVLKEAQKEGQVRAIGVSNFGVRHLEEVKHELGGGIDVNQIELHPWCQQRDIVEYCKREGILVQSYSPLTQGVKLGDPTLIEVARRHEKTPAQILIRWCLQTGYVPLPKSDQEHRIRENVDVFGWEIDQQGMDSLEQLDQGSAGAVTWNPVGVDY